MIPRPRVFISSSLQLTTVREELQTFFPSVGIDIGLYEKNLTPSTRAATYRADIVEYEFVIVIVGPVPGTPTPSGKTGTEEEWEIAKMHGIPLHIYRYNPASDPLKVSEQNATSSMNQDLAQRVEENMASVYYYGTDEDLIQRIKASTADVIHEIAYHRFIRQPLSFQDARNVANLHDYKQATVILSPIREALDFDRLGGFEPWRTDFLPTVCIEILDRFWASDSLFINPDLSRAFKGLFQDLRALTHFLGDSTDLVPNTEVTQWTNPYTAEQSVIRFVNRIAKKWDQPKFDQLYGQVVATCENCFELTRQVGP